jgi:hypothetical protein
MAWWPSPPRCPSARSTRWGRRRTQRISSVMRAGWCPRSSGAASPLRPSWRVLACSQLRAAGATSPRAAAAAGARGAAADGGAGAGLLVECEMGGSVGAGGGRGTDHGGRPGLRPAAARGGGWRAAGRRRRVGTAGGHDSRWRMRKHRAQHREGVLEDTAASSAVTTDRTGHVPRSQAFLPWRKRRAEPQCGSTCASCEPPGWSQAVTEA